MHSDEHVSSILKLNDTVIGGVFIVIVATGVVGFTWEPHRPHGGAAE